MASIDDIVQASHSEISFEFVRASGPGGQNVNKVATSSQLRFDVAGSQTIPQAAKQRLKQLAGRRLSAGGILIIEARRYRTQEQNREDAVARFDDLLRRALQQPKRRVPTKATAASRERRLTSKKRKSDLKRTRRSRAHDE